MRPIGYFAVLQGVEQVPVPAVHLYPAANGTLLLQHIERKSGIDIGAKGYSYYVNQNGVVKGENNLKFSPKAVLDTMKHI